MGKKIGAILISILAIGLIGFTSVKLFSQDGYFNSKNKMTYSDDSVEKKEFKDYGLVNEEERYHSTIDLGGGTYEGEVILVDGEEIADGLGKAVWDDGDFYEGELRDGLRHGQGKNLHTNGDIYEGEYKDDIIHGQGKYIFADGSVYEGEYKDGMPHGYGQGILVNGDVIEGRFEEGNFVGK